MRTSAALAAELNNTTNRPLRIAEVRPICFASIVTPALESTEIPAHHRFFSPFALALHMIFCQFQTPLQQVGVTDMGLRAIGQTIDGIRSRIKNEVFSIPRLIVVFGDLVPRRLSVPTDVGKAAFDAAPMHGGIAADQLDL